MSAGKIRAVLLFDLDYPEMKRASVSLLVADASASRWVHYFDPFYDDDLVEQPVGQVNLYLSDFIDFTGLPAESCLEFHRPSKTDLDAGVSRFVSSLG